MTVWTKLWMMAASSAEAGSRLAVSPAVLTRLTAIYRIIQQALTNATKHCHGTRAVIENSENPTTVGLGVRDDGDGFHPAQHCGFGLLGMCERVQLLHAAVQIGSSSGEGTPVTAGLPQRRAAPGASAAPYHPPNRYGCGPLSEEQVRVRRDGRC